MARLAERAVGGPSPPRVSSLGVSLPTLPADPLPVLRPGHQPHHTPPRAGGPSVPGARPARLPAPQAPVRGQARETDILSGAGLGGVRIGGPGGVPWAWLLPLTRHTQTAAPMAPCTFRRLWTAAGEGQHPRRPEPHRQSQVPDPAGGAQGSHLGTLRSSRVSSAHFYHPLPSPRPPSLALPLPCHFPFWGESQSPPCLPGLELLRYQLS